MGVARWLLQEDNPLTARVAVNRFWSRLFGRGLLDTEEDFGTQGNLPDNPELLDWLAVEFRGTGWDMKRLIKTMVMSATYRQSAEVRGDLAKRDPRNVRLGRGPRFRLEAEMVRQDARAVRVPAAAAEPVAGGIQRPARLGDEPGRGSVSAWVLHLPAEDGSLSVDGNL
jgi:hypothetical protein